MSTTWHAQGCCPSCIDAFSFECFCFEKWIKNDRQRFTQSKIDQHCSFFLKAQAIHRS